MWFFWCLQCKFFFFTIYCVVFVLSLQVFNVKYFFFLVLVFGVTCVGILLPWGFCYMCGFCYMWCGFLLYLCGFCYMCGFLLYLCGFCYMCGFCFTCVGIFLPVWDFIYPCGFLFYLCGCCEVLIYLSGSAVSVGQAEVQGFRLGTPS